MSNNGEQVKFTWWEEIDTDNGLWHIPGERMKHETEKEFKRMMLGDWDTTSEIDFTYPDNQYLEKEKYYTYHYGGITNIPQS